MAPIPIHESVQMILWAIGEVLKQRADEVPFSDVISNGDIKKVLNDAYGRGVLPSYNTWLPHRLCGMISGKLLVKLADNQYQLTPDGERGIPEDRPQLPTRTPTWARGQPSQPGASGTMASGGLMTDTDPPGISSSAGENSKSTADSVADSWNSVGDDGADGTEGEQSTHTVERASVTMAENGGLANTDARGISATAAENSESSAGSVPDNMSTDGDDGPEREQ